jgi:rSAM/selenodomain-associated transferase 1
MRPVIVLFAKAPLAGRVKTRLSPPLTAALAARLHDAFVRDTLESLHSLDNFADLELHTDTPTDAWADSEVPRKLQHEGDLGLKMLQALDEALKSGRERAMIVGSDSPTLPPDHLNSLLRAPEDVALGPTLDGGFYAIACTRVHSRMFDGVVWSAPDTLDRTVRAVHACGMSVAQGAAWYDVDTREDLERLASDPRLSPRTAAVLEACKNGSFL